MSAALELRVLPGQIVIAALVCNNVTTHYFGRRMMISGNRQPCGLLICIGGKIDAFTASGDAMPLAEVEALCPGSVAQVTAAVHR